MMMTFGPSALVFVASACAALVSLITLSARKTPDALEELTYRLRSPRLWALQHPLKALGRLRTR